MFLSQLIEMCDLFNIITINVVVGEYSILLQPEGPRR